MRFLSNQLHTSNTMANPHMYEYTNEETDKVDEDERLDRMMAASVKPRVHVMASAAELEAKLTQSAPPTRKRVNPAKAGELPRKRKRDTDLARIIPNAQSSFRVRPPLPNMAPPAPVDPEPEPPTTTTIANSSSTSDKLAAKMLAAAGIAMIVYGVLKWAHARGHTVADVADNTQ